MADARTQEFRLGMLSNGYWPLLNDCKKSIEKGWPKKRPDEAEVRSWSRSMLASTGMKIDGDLAVVDVDVRDPMLVEALAAAVDKEFPAMLRQGLVRHAGGPKEAWFARVDKPFGRLSSFKWHAAGTDFDDPDVPKHLIECFGSRSTRQFGVHGPHARGKQGRVISTYAWAGDASPATVPRDALPVLPYEAFNAACNLFDGIAAARLVRVVGSQRGSQPRMRFELEDEMAVDTQDLGEMTIAELEEHIRTVRRHNGVWSLRCSGSFHDATRVRTDSHLINWGRYGIGIWDAMTDTTWHRRSMGAVAKRLDLMERLRRRNPLATK
jgi:hypothetical protein